MRRAFVFTWGLFLIFLAPAISEASRASHFKGWYQVLSRKDVSPESRDYVLIDVDTLEALWHRYSESAFPPDLEEYRNEPSILAAFTDRSLYFFLLERGALIGNDYLSLQGEGGDQMELRKRPDNRFDLAVRDKDRISLYLLAPPKASPEKD